MIPAVTAILTSLLVLLTSPVMGRASLILLVVLVAGSSPASAVPFAQVRWDSCGSYEFNKPFQGPGTYHQVITGRGFQLPVLGHTIRLRATSSNVYGYPYRPIPDAWRFDSEGCQAGRLELGAKPQPCPFLGSGVMAIAIEAEHDGFDLHILVSFSYEPTVPDPNVTYELGQLAYDHSRSAAGLQDPAIACGHADQEMCFVIEEASWADANGDSHPIGFEYFSGVSWQDPIGFFCFADVPVEPATWGGSRPSTAESYLAECGVIVATG